jgi:hypothetical protein
MTRPDLPQRPGQARPRGTIAGDVARDKNRDGATHSAPFLARSVLRIEGPEPPRRSSAGPAWIGRSLLKA